jgi:hypothetical protein
VHVENGCLFFDAVEVPILNLMALPVMSRRGGRRLASGTDVPL